MSNLLDKLIALVLKKAKTDRMNAGFSGAWDDGGASRLENQVKFFNHGRAGTIPDEWKQFQTQLDPEYQDYIRLQNKFGKRG